MSNKICHFVWLRNPYVIIYSMWAIYHLDEVADVFERSEIVYEENSCPERISSIVHVMITYLGLFRWNSKCDFGHNEALSRELDSTTLGGGGGVFWGGSELSHFISSNKNWKSCVQAVTWDAKISSEIFISLIKKSVVSMFRPSR